MTRRILLGVLVAVTLACPLAALAQAPDYSPLEAALRDNIALRNQIIGLRKALGESQQAYGTCASERVRLEVLIEEAVVAGKVATLVTLIEAAHPGFTVDPKTGALVPKPKG